jgi:hypothetical protein
MMREGRASKARTRRGPTIALALGLSAAPAAGLAQDEVDRPVRPDDVTNYERHWEGFSVYLDQDVFFPPAFDQDYTMGVEFVCQGRWVRDRKLIKPVEWLDTLFGLRGVHTRLQTDSLAPNESPPTSPDKLGFAVHSIHSGNSAFAPAKATLGLTEPIYDDRPYASLLYLKVRRTSAKGRQALVSDFTLGVLGLRVSEWVQTQIHKSNGDVLPGGWPNQISDGGELTLKYRASPRWLLVATNSPKKHLVDMDLAGSLEGNLGYYTNASAGGRLRIGHVRSPWWAFERNAIADVRGGRSYRSRFGGDRGFLQELYGWASAGGTAWAYNAFLQGQFRHSNVTLSFDEDSVAPIKRFTADAQAGVTLRVRPGIFATYAVQWLSPTFGGPKQRIHSWGSIYFGYQK